MASLTKVIGTTSAVIQLYAAHRIDLDAPVQRYLPEFTGTHKELVTVRHLLTHSSGLPAWRPLYKEATSPDDALHMVYTTPLDTLPGVRMVYSDLGAILLGKIVAFAVVALAECLVMMSLLFTYFGLSFAGDPTPFVVGTILYAFCVAAFGTSTAARLGF